MSAKGELRFVGVVEKAGKREARVRVFPEFCDGLMGLEDFSHLVILYWIHLRDSEEERGTLRVFPRGCAGKVEKGVFACRGPSRPNPVGLCVVELLKVDGCILTVEGLDALKGSPIVDIKPYVPMADAIPNARIPEWAMLGFRT